MIPTIPRDAYNAFPLVARDVQDFATDRRRNSWRSFWQTEYEESLANLGRIAGVRGPILYNPFGGADVHYPFSLSPEITDDFCQGSESFGGPNSIIDYIRRGEGDGSFEQWRQLQSFDNVQSLEIVGHQYCGLGGLVVTRLIDFLGAAVKGIYYFRIEQDGRLSFLNRREVEAFNDSTIRNRGISVDREVNVVSEFYHGETTKRFWYMPYMIVDPNVPDNLRLPETQSNFPVFVQTLDFDTLLVKAANSWWNDCAHPPEIVRIALDPTRQRNARVLADSNVDDPLSYGNHRPRPMWREGYEPGFVDLNRAGVRRNMQMHFGYNSGANFGDGKDLITAQHPDILFEIERRKIYASIPGIEESRKRVNKLLADAERDPE